ncbi:hypothetical protein TNCV_44591 [Trichonephila clavipes]|nr:hypothetical protein TNCV_44591 [Trichonephila clavipes]
MYVARREKRLSTPEVACSILTGKRLYNNDALNETNRLRNLFSDYQKCYENLDHDRELKCDRPYFNFGSTSHCERDRSQRRYLKHSPEGKRFNDNGEVKAVMNYSLSGHVADFFEEGFQNLVISLKLLIVSITCCMDLNRSLVSMEETTLP